MSQRPDPKQPKFQPETLPLHSTRLLYETQSYRTISRWLFGLFIVFIVALFLPWQQNIRGDGLVSALSPSDRPQSLPSRIDGRIDRWLVQEGQFVARGTPIVAISEIKDEYMDPEVVTRTEEQLAAKRSSNSGKRSKAAALSEQIEALQDVLGLKLEQARNKVLQTQAKVLQATLEDSIASDQLDRRTALFDSPLGLVSLNDLQSSRMKAQSASAKLVAEQNDLLNAEIELRTLEAEYREKIEKARSDRAGTLAEVADGEAEVSKLRNKVTSLEVRQSYYEIKAPQDGYVVKAIRAGVGELVKAGDPIVSVQPATPRQAVELFVRAMDVPLLRPGRLVRLEFNGWPALQFSGWPSVAVGTFGGEVKVVDQVASTDGRFRVLVVPDPNDEPWPPQLRIGTTVNGWAMLDNVRIWFELWRQLNGFPPSIALANAPMAAEASGTAPGGKADGGGKK